MTRLTIARTVLTMSKPDLSKVGIKRNDYKAIKRMDRIQLSEYLSRIWKRGFEAGQKAMRVNTSQPKNEEVAEE